MISDFMCRVQRILYVGKTNFGVIAEVCLAFELCTFDVDDIEYFQRITKKSKTIKIDYKIRKKYFYTHISKSI